MAKAKLKEANSKIDITGIPTDLILDYIMYSGIFEPIHQINTSRILEGKDSLLSPYIRNKIYANSDGQEYINESEAYDALYSKKASYSILNENNHTFLLLKMWELFTVTDDGIEIFEESTELPAINISL